jgi:NADH-quinone oxidoreductase subunit H
VELILLIIKLGIVLVVLLFVASYLVWAERKLLGRIWFAMVPTGQEIRAPQPLADLIKLVTKEDTVPGEADKTIFLLAPAVVAVTAMLIFAVIPFGNNLMLRGKPIPMVVSDLNVGLLFVLALSSLGVYGVTLGGWASNSKYSLLGGIRGAAQMISYELSLGLSLVPIVMLARSFSLVDIVSSAGPLSFYLSCGFFFDLLISAWQKSNGSRSAEAENELVAGYHTEYSGMRFGLFFLGEYITLIVLGGLVATFFLGGWRGPLLPHLVWFMLKVLAIVFVMIWIRGTLPRLRYDQLMSLGWKVLIPISLLNIMATGALILMMRD